MARIADELYEPDLDWYCQHGDAAHGARSNYSEGSGTQSGTANTAPYTDHQIGYWKDGVWNPGEVDRARKIFEVFRQLAVENQRVLWLRYQPPPLSQRPEVRARLGLLAGVALHITSEKALPKLLTACQKNTEATLEGARTRAENALRKAHKEYRELRDGVTMDWVEVAP